MNLNILVRLQFLLEMDEINQNEQCCAHEHMSYDCMFSYAA